MSDKPKRAQWGAQAHLGETGKLPVSFPRSLGPNAMKYLKEVVESGLTADMTSRFEQAFAKTLGVKHCIATPGCTPALHVLALACGWAPGDEIIISYFNGSQFTYVYNNTVIVTPDRVDVLETKFDNRLTLSACHPEYSAAERIVRDKAFTLDPWRTDTIMIVAIDYEANQVGIVSLPRGTTKSTPCRM